MRSTLHDMANVLAGVKGLMDLNVPGQPINLRDRQRMEAVIEEGIATLDRCRHLAMATLPDAPMEPGGPWRDQLLEELEPMGTLFRSRFELAFQGAPEWDQWPGALLRGYARAVTRQVLPYARGGTMAIQCGAAAEGWLLRWTPATAVPEGLTASSQDRPSDICSRWAVRVGSVLGASLACEAGSLCVRIPRTAPVPGPFRGEMT
jgi:hypothetical protein